MKRRKKSNNLSGADDDEYIYYKVCNNFFSTLRWCNVNSERQK